MQPKGTGHSKSNNNGKSTFTFDSMNNLKLSKGKNVKTNKNTTKSK